MLDSNLEKEWSSYTLYPSHEDGLCLLTEFDGPVLVDSEADDNMKVYTEEENDNQTIIDRDMNWKEIYPRTCSHNQSTDYKIISDSHSKLMITTMRIQKLTNIK